MGITRSAFLIDAQGKIAQAWYKIRPEETVPELRKALGSLQS
jgi:peroxiredoxin